MILNASKIPTVIASNEKSARRIVLFRRCWKSGDGIKWKFETGPSYK